MSFTTILQVLVVTCSFVHSSECKTFERRETVRTNTHEEVVSMCHEIVRDMAHHEVDQDASIHDYYYKGFDCMQNGVDDIVGTILPTQIHPTWPGPNMPGCKYDPSPTMTVAEGFRKLQICNLGGQSILR